ncbi:hypothetical protein MKY96_32485 [Paenibacillus sp. FSL R7-0302]|uniref:hypothetical protein n=1 Tax=Paenibacillus sp. FSL R7-0302 TaxID=2921681 RepID=UPI0030FA994B
MGSAKEIAFKKLMKKIEEIEGLKDEMFDLISHRQAAEELSVNVLVAVNAEIVRLERRIAKENDRYLTLIATYDQTMGRKDRLNDLYEGNAYFLHPEDFKDS